MSKAMQALKDFLLVAPSVVFPDEVLELLKPVESENAKLRDFIRQIWPVVEHPALWCHGCPYYKECMTPSDDGRVTIYRGGCQWREDMRETARELGVEVDG